MDEEQINELSQLAEEIASQEFVQSTNEPTTDAAAVFINAVNEIAADRPLADDPDVVEEDTNFIEPNVTVSVSDEATARFSSAEWFNKMSEQRIVLAGLGGIGSWVALLLGRCHPNIISIYDGDSMEVVNMAGQLCPQHLIGKRKTEVSAYHLKEYCNFYDIMEHGRYDSDSCDTADIMICGFDNMQARKFFYTYWRAHVSRSANPEKCLFIDGRLNAEEWQIFAIRGNDAYRMTEYESKWLFDDSEVEEALCSYKQTSFCASMIASLIVNIFVNFVANLCDPIIERDVPFITEYDAKTMYFKTLQ